MAKWFGSSQRVKAAFGLQIARGLRKKYRLRTRVNVDSVDVIKGDNWFLETEKSFILGKFIYKKKKYKFSDGYMFRFKIAVPREIALHMKELTSKGVTKYRDSAESLKMERELILIPKITVSLHT